ncbi:MAG: hypothetical protein OEM30_09580 [Gammaproteobacteria bacterium]|nr:hypothetical protein [Gammaproteobacteria bacterium]
MMLRSGSSLLVLAVLVFPGVGQAAPSSYDECILESMKGVSSDIAAKAIISSCRNLYTEQQDVVAPAESTAPQAATPVLQPVPVVTGPGRPLTAAELDKLRARIKAFGSSYTAIAQNKNENLTVTEMTIAVWDDSNSSSLREYPLEVMIAPMESVETRFTVHYTGDELSWAWKLASAKGIDLPD